MGGIVTNSFPLTLQSSSLGFVVFQYRKEGGKT